jgi:choline-sulfatase
MGNLRPDILIFMSDQQDGRLLGCAGHGTMRTPNIDALAARGTVFRSAYTSCPLCVPARAGFLTGQLSSANDVYGNDDAIREDQATFLHCLAAQGYETVLVGRMHFLGPDQRHGFTKRIGGDFSHVYWPTYAPDEAWMRNMGPYVHTTGAGGCLRVVGGGGVSPAREYDLAVTDWALDYLAEQHRKPQCIVVGTYGPHFPYVAEKSLFGHYRAVATLPRTFHLEGGELRNPFYRSKQQYPEPDVALAAQAAYRGLIEEQDHLFGRVMAVWEEYRRSSGRPGVTVFTSDHGDQCGEHNLYGKQTLFEGSVRIPLVIEGDGLVSGRSVASPASLLDLAPTLLDLTDGMRLPRPGGRSLLGMLTGRAEPTDRAVIAEHGCRSEDIGLCQARMVRKGDWKLMHFANEHVDDMLFNVREDPLEQHECSAARPEVVRGLRTIAYEDWRPDEAARRRGEKRAHHHILRQAGEAAGGPPEECWMGYAGRLRLPDADGSHVCTEAREMAEQNIGQA